MKQELWHAWTRAGAALDDSGESKEKAVALAVFLMQIQKQVREQGIGVLEDFSSNEPLLDRGLFLVRMGMEPELVQRILYTSLVTNAVDARLGFLILEGVRAIQTGQSAIETKELLKAYLPFGCAEPFEQKLFEDGIMGRCDGVLSQVEVSRLLQGNRDSQSKKRKE